MPEMSSIYFLIPVIFLAALLFSSVGHGGASAYLAAMALVGVAPAQMRPVALLLNVFVASIALYKFYRAGAFSGRLFWPLGVAAVPAAFMGGGLVLPAHIYKPMIGAVLLLAAWHLLNHAKQADASEIRPAAPAALAGTGALLGFLSGLTGVGGGIFLSPLLLFLKWGQTKVVSGVAAAFILVNSVAGLAGVFRHGTALPQGVWWWVVAAVLGGLIGAELGSRRLTSPHIRQLLALVLVFAGAKMLF